MLGLVVGAAAARAREPAPVQGRLTSVSCPTDTFCMAVGLRYTGHRSEFDGPVSGLAYRWDGAAWHVMPTVAPDPGYTSITLDTVSCTSSTACVALGFMSKSAGEVLIAERWNGSFWRFMGIQRPGYVVTEDVSCAGVLGCVAVGSRYPESDPHSEQVTWQLVGDTFELRPAAARPFPQEYLTGVSCVTDDNCTAVGGETLDGRPLMEHWNGLQWSWVGPLPYPRSGSFGPTLAAVSCPAPRTCVAVGADPNSFAFIENRNAGGPWTYGLPGPHNDPESGGGTGLHNVSCDVFHRCAAVSQTIDRGGIEYPILAWRDFQTGGFTFPHSPAFFGDVACREAACVYVGSDRLDDEGQINPHHPVIYRGRAHPIQQAIPPPPAP